MGVLLSDEKHGFFSSKVLCFSIENMISIHTDFKRNSRNPWVPDYHGIITLSERLGALYFVFMVCGALRHWTESSSTVKISLVWYQGKKELFTWGYWHNSEHAYFFCQLQSWTHSFSSFLSPADTFVSVICSSAKQKPPKIFIAITSSHCETVSLNTKVLTIGWGILCIFLRDLSGLWVLLPSRLVAGLLSTGVCTAVLPWGELSTAHVLWAKHCLQGSEYLGKLRLGPTAWAKHVIFTACSLFCVVAKDHWRVGD